MTFKRKVQWVSLFLIMFLFGMFYMQSSHEIAMTQRTISEAAEGVHEGEVVKGFSATDLSGRIVNLEDFYGENLVLFFFTSWCQVCGEQWAQFEQAKQEGLLDDVKMVAINVTTTERDVKDVKSYVENLPFQDITVLLDEKGYVQKLYKIIGIPTVLFIDDSKTIVSRNHSFVTVEQMKDIPIFR